MSAGHAGGYFSREDYYIRGPRTGAVPGSVLGLSGAVGEEEFRALCAGTAPDGNVLVRCRPMRDPETGEVVETRRAGNDCTFSAPKSVSVAHVAGVEGGEGGARRCGPVGLEAHGVPLLPLPPHE
ncbi:relaxase domain-containing protein [Geomonas propionica]|uniref:Relaxase domain-containing protein n=1 Tax=Geomonas propionica TaxID=2798582 RepID=A0ABS0YW48_9BACT|nr:relaxase domain-containing protein [Geomonas propionica]